MWFFNKTYRAKEWEIVYWSYVTINCGSDPDGGFSAYFMFRNKATGKQKVVKIGSPNWTYDTLWQLDRAIFKKTGIQIIDKTAKMPA